MLAHVYAALNNHFKNENSFNGQGRLLNIFLTKEGALVCFSDSDGITSAAFVVHGQTRFTWVKRIDDDNKQ